MYIYKQTERSGGPIRSLDGTKVLSYMVADLWTVGYYDPQGRFNPESDWNTKEEAVERVSKLNGDAAVRRLLDEALNTGDGSYRP